MVERKKIRASDIEALILQGFSEEQICEKLELTVAYYKEARKIFGITLKHKKSIVGEFDLIDDREPKVEVRSNLALGLATALSNTNVPNPSVESQA